tara:strand:- start:6670 stop:7530 length:861 start_codon:yes stop_codon:yes gene_type:complete
MTFPKFSTYTFKNKYFYGVLKDNFMADLSNLAPWNSLKHVIEDGGMEKLIKIAKNAPITHKEFKFLRPILNPEKIICVGVNFPDRNAEYNDGKKNSSYMSLFPRFERGFTGHLQPLIRPSESSQLDYEGEIAVIIGKKGRRIKKSDAFNYIAGITLCNEGTIRDWTRHGKFNVTQGKNWDNSGSMGPWIVPFFNSSQLDDICIRTIVNGEIRQEDKTSNMIYSIKRQIEYISTFTTLVPGDIIVTGTPTGSGARLNPPIYLKPGDVVEVFADGIGTLVNQVEDEII